MAIIANMAQSFGVEEAMSRRGLVFDLAVIFASVALFCFLSLYQLNLPGLYYDEAADAVPAMQITLGQEVELFNQSGIWLGDRAFPVMVMDYVGAVNTYALLPFFALFGVDVLSLRLMTVTVGVLVIILSYLFTKELFNRGVAAITVLLLAVHPSFVFWSRQGIYVTSVMGVMAMGSLLALLKWHKSGKGIYFYIGCFLLGLGLSAKILFVWFIIALGVMYALLRLLGNVRRFTLKQFALGLLVFGAGAWMILLYNIEKQGTIAVISKNLVTSQYGVSNLDFLQNLSARLQNFRVLLEGGHFWYLGGLFSNRLYPYVLLAALASVFVFLLVRRAAKSDRLKIGFIVGLIALVLVQSCFTISGLWPTHLLILLPLSQMVIAISVSLLRRLAPFGKAALLLGAVAVTALFIRDLQVDLQYHRALRETRGWSHHSDAIYRLASFLDGQEEAEPIAMDWGIKTSVQILTQGRVSPVEIFQYSQEPNSTFFDWLYGNLMNPNCLYIFHAEESTVFPRYKAFEEFSHKFEKKVNLEQTIAQHDGKAVYLIYSSR